MRVARPVRRAGRGDGPVERPAPRLGPTLHRAPDAGRQGLPRRRPRRLQPAGRRLVDRYDADRRPGHQRLGHVRRHGDRAARTRRDRYPLGQCTQFTSWAFTRRAPGARSTPASCPPWARSGTACYDNAVIESFWSRMQVELLDRRQWRTRVELANAIFEYLEIFHNRQRRHSALGMLTPVEFETRHQSATVA